MSIEKYLNEINNEVVMESTGGTVSFLGGTVKAYYPHMDQEEVSKYKNTIPKVLKVAEKYMRDNKEVFIKELLSKYKHWHDGKTISADDLNKKLIIDTIEIFPRKIQDDGKQRYYITIWRKHSPDFFGNHSVNTQVGISDGKIDEKYTHLCMFEG